MNPVKHKADLEAEQKYSSHCIYHLAKTHVTDDCHVKKECERMLASKRSKSGSSTPQNSVSSVSQGNLRHITEEEFADALDEDKDESSDHFTNDTNESDLLYFARVSKHYLHLVRNETCISDVPRHHMEHPIIIDSGANYNMFHDKTKFRHSSTGYW
jgi:hypothetical protein